MSFKIAAVDDGIIEIGQGHIIGNTSQNHLNQTGVCARSVTQPERHMGEVVATPGCGKGRLNPVSFFQRNDMISARSVNTTENFRTG